MRKAELHPHSVWEARPPQMLAQPMEDRQLLKRTEAAPPKAEARPSRPLEQPMEDRQLLKRTEATVPTASSPEARPAQTLVSLLCWAAQQTRPQQRWAVALQLALFWV